MTEKTVRKYKAQNVCITGHSLGAAFGLLVGRKLALEGQHVETHLFNPPYLTLESLIRKGKKTLGAVLPAVNDLIKSVGNPLERLLDSEADKKLREEMEREFSQLQEWLPNLYVNEHDVISNEYLNYFENAKQKGASSSHLTSKSSRALRKVIRIEAKSYHLIPSVVLHKNDRNHRVKKLTPHKLNQWYKYQTLNESKTYHLELLQKDAV